MLPICDLPDGIFTAGTWSQDDVILFGAMPLLYRVAAAGGVPVVIPTSDGQNNHTMPWFLPDGQHFIYLRDPKGSDAAGTYLTSLDAKPDESPKRLLTTTWQAQYVPSADSKMGYLVYMSDGTVMAQPFDNHSLDVTGASVLLAEKVGTSGGRWAAFSASTNGSLAYWGAGSSDYRSTQLTWRDGKGGSPGDVGDVGYYRWISLPPNSNRAAVAVLAPMSQSNLAAAMDIWLFDFSRSGARTRFTYGGAIGGAVWSPDESRIVYGSRRNGVIDLYEKPVNGSTEEVLLLKTKEDKAPDSWSRDGFILYSMLDSKNKRDIWVLPMSGERTPVPFLQTRFDERDARFSPDGQWVAYVSDKSGRDEVYIRAFGPKDGAESLVSTGGGVQPRWRNDGKELYYGVQEGKIMAVEITGGTTFSAGTPKELFVAPRSSNNGVIWDAAADGKRFLFARQLEQTTSSPFTMVLNWQTGLKK